MLRDYKKIKAWKAAKSFVLTIYKCTKNFPEEEKYGLISQLRRSVVSVATNIAEGASRQHKRDYVNFLYNAKASLAEAECLIDIANELGYFVKDDLIHLYSIFDEAAKSLYGLIKAVEAEI